MTVTTTHQYNDRAERKNSASCNGIADGVGVTVSIRESNLVSSNNELYGSIISIIAIIIITGIRILGIRISL